MSSNKANSKDIPKKDPYKVLGLQFGVSDVEIAKAYRTLARTLHPDKLVSQNLSAHEIQKATNQFHDIQLARSFLLDDEHKTARQKYDTQLASEQIRRNANIERDKSMSEKRKRMRDELQFYEAEAIRKNNTQQQSVRNDALYQHQHKATKDKLSSEGIKLREQYAAKEAIRKQREREKVQKDLQNRQIRLKWSRKKIKADPSIVLSPSEDTIAKMLSQICNDVVEQVQMLGDKGNAALVTFVHERSCQVAVEYYRTSDTWRAVYVNKEKQQKEDNDRHDRFDSQTIGSVVSHRDHENINDWKVRQASEREALLQQLQEEENDQNNNTIGSNRKVNGDENGNGGTTKFGIPFPPSFPSDIEYKSNDPLDQLEQLESLLFNGIVPDNIILQQQMKVVKYI